MYPVFEYSVPLSSQDLTKMNSSAVETTTLRPIEDGRSEDVKRPHITVTQSSRWQIRFEQHKLRREQSSQEIVDSS